jgi:hypothetical protein
MLFTEISPCITGTGIIKSAFPNNIWAYKSIDGTYW